MKTVDSLRPESGLRVIVTAGASGIGRCIGEAFAKAGARVRICDIDGAALEEADFAEGRSLCDVRDHAAVGRFIAEAAAGMGGLDVVINNAGIAGPTAGVDEIDADAWRQTIDVNLNGQYHVAHHATAHLRQSRGVMINLASVAGRLAFAYRTPYAASKWAVVGLTKSLAAELGPEGVRVNAILPGIVRGRRIEGVIRDRAAALGIPYEEMERRNLEKISLRRMVDPEEIAAAALFLCAPGGRSITGQAISVCGNVEAL
ncbi:SDR family oxidoreductase [Limimaricola litoreus]|uniref:SDR family oxidoreductase n=1 Tax=Limimaricola litoreus TaxID=2955316 RepID=A0A9X2JRC6_9RHOB|nr:SDR family oxidoreductase [Limimaricola litoreus]MCP1170295.1 SDR family oxidoreductase [Limimaricola litoreus]